MRKILVCLLLPFALGACDRLPRPINAIPQDGPYLLLELEDLLGREQILEALSERMAESLRSASIRYSARGANAEAARIRLTDPADLPRAREAIAAITGEFEVYVEPDGLIEVRPAQGADRVLTDQAIIQSVEVLQRRLDPTGIFRAQVERHGDNQILVRVADTGTRDAARAIIAPLGQLTFHLVIEREPATAVTDRIPTGAMIAQPFDEDGRVEVVKERPELTGVHVMNARPSTDPQTGEFVLAFRLNSEGTRLFCRITRDNPGHASPSCSTIRL